MKKFLAQYGEEAKNEAKKIQRVFIYPVLFIFVWMWVFFYRILAFFKVYSTFLFAMHTLMTSLIGVFHALIYVYLNDNVTETLKNCLKMAFFCFFKKD